VAREKSYSRHNSHVRVPECWQPGRDQGGSEYANHTGIIDAVKVTKGQKARARGKSCEAKRSMFGIFLT